MRRRSIICVFVALAVNCAFAGEDQDAYCKYILEEAAAQRDLLRTPSATAGVVQPNTGLPAQLVWGASTSIASMRKAGLTIAVARRNCELYQATTAAQQQIVYALPALEKAALSHRLELIQQADSQLDALIAEEARLVQAQNATQPMLYSLHAGKVKLYKDRADTQAKAALLYTPPANPSPIKELVNTKQASEVANQKAIDHLVRQNNWDVTFEAGMRHQANPFFVYGVGPYVTTSLSYNLASKAIDRHLDAAANSYAAWKRNEEGDVVRSAVILKQQIMTSISGEEQQLDVARAEDAEIELNLKLVDGVGTSTALNFRNQLLVDRLFLRIEIGDASYRLGQLQNYLDINF